MTELLDADDMRLLGQSFESALADATDPDAALYELGWADLLDASPRQGAALAFAALGTTGAAAGLLDDVVARALGLPIEATAALVLPGAHDTAPPGRHTGSSVLIEGIVSARVDVADTAYVPVLADDGAFEVVAVPTTALRHAPVALDPARPYRRVKALLATADTAPVEVGGEWLTAVADAQTALAHQLVAGARWMLAEARQHAVDRVQFGRAIGSFQAVRHKLAESLVAIEGAVAVADEAVTNADPLVAMLAKSLAGRAARDTAKHAQQVLAGIGFTTEHRFHLWLKRTLVLDTLFGSSTTLPGAIGTHLVTQGTPRLLTL